MATNDDERIVVVTYLHVSSHCYSAGRLRPNSHSCQSSLGISDLLVTDDDYPATCLCHCCKERLSTNRLVDGDRTLQVMPIREGRSHYSYSCDHPLRVLAFFGASKTLNAWAISDEHRAALIGCHFEGEQDKLVGALCQLTQKTS